MQQVGRLGGPTWFRLGDRDLATHAVRTERLARGETLTAITADLCRSLGIKAKVLPMTDDRVRTIVHSGGDALPFQHYFVRLQCAVQVERLTFDGVERARFNAALNSIGGDRLVIIICPSNPYLSIDPILALPGLRAWIEGTGAPVVAVSPIVGGAAIKGPAAKIMRDFGIRPATTAIARHYLGLIDGIVIDTTDAASEAQILELGLTVRTAQTIMRAHNDRINLARECLSLAEELSAEAS
jgi:LPPG:FO 2-phospho-L-lactate transferase